MGGWRLLERNTTGLIVGDPLSRATVTQDASGIELQLNTSCLIEAGQGITVGKSVASSGTMLRRWSVPIESYWNGSSYGGHGNRTGIDLWGATTGDDDDMWLACTIGYEVGPRAIVQVHFNDVLVYNSFSGGPAFSNPGDFPIRVAIEEQLYWTAGGPSIHYHARWKKASDPDYVTVYDTGEIATPARWAAKSYSFCAWYNAPLISKATYLDEEVYDDTAPTISNVSPANGATGESITALLEYDTTEAITGVDPAEEIITVNGVVAWSAGAASAGFLVERTAISDGYHYRVMCLSAFEPGTLQTWTVHSANTLGGATDQTFIFTTSSTASAGSGHIAELFKE